MKKKKKKKAEDGTALTDIRKLSRQFRDLTERDPVTKGAPRTNPPACRNDCYAARWMKPGVATTNY